MKKITTFFFTLCILFSCKNEPIKNTHTFFVGGYTMETFGGKGKGIYTCELNSETGEMKLIRVFENAVNPSYLALHLNGKHLYAVNETGGEKPGFVSAYNLLENDSLVFINEKYTRGDYPCHLSIAPNNHLLVANYGGGSVSIFPVMENGGLDNLTSMVKHSGKGTFEERQEGPHAHYFGAAINDSSAFAVDLGTDQIFHYRLRKGGTLGVKTVTKSEPGKGPRHIAFHPTLKTCYVVLEFTNEIEAYAYTDELKPFERFQTIGTLKEKLPFYAATSSAIKINPSGKYLYVGNRGIPNATEDNIGIFSIHPESGQLAFLGNMGTKGKVPRDFDIDPTGNFLIVANQESGNMVSFRINQETGMLTGTGFEMDMPSGTCVVFK